MLKFLYRVDTRVIILHDYVEFAHIRYTNAIHEWVSVEQLLSMPNISQEIEDYLEHLATHDEYAESLRLREIISL